MKIRDKFDSKPKVRCKEKPLSSEEKNVDAQTKGRFPSWLHRKLPKGTSLWSTAKAMREGRLNTVCEEAKCPNLMECWSKKTATFLVLGKTCTRSCGFCDIGFSKTPDPPEHDEPERIATSVQKLGLKHVVITMVTRDDLPDGGANHLALIVQVLRKTNPELRIELLTSDFLGNEKSLDTILDSSPDIFNHNIETVRRLTPQIRHKATYEKTLHVLQYVQKKKKIPFIKSGLMVGFGESESEVFETIQDLYQAGCEIITIGQYLQPNPKKRCVKEFVPPEQFDRYKQFGEELGVKQMHCGPLVRSSYASELLLQKMVKSHG